MKSCIYLLFVFSLGFATTASAEIFQWTDNDGNVQFGDRPPASSGAKRVEVEVNSYESVSVESAEAFKSGVSNKGRAKKVVMYSTTWCGVCKRARRFLKSQKISFKEYDVEKSRKGKKDYARLKGRGVPILLVGGQRMNGFSASRFSRMYSSGKN